MTEPITHRGRCHCGGVTFEVDAPRDLTVEECNCSMCSLTGYLHLIVPRSRFRVLTGGELLTTYTFNTHAAKHTFCSICGIKAFYVPRSNPDGVSVNVRCLDRATIGKVDVELFDGKNWEENAKSLRGKSRDEA